MRLRAGIKDDRVQIKQVTTELNNTKIQIDNVKNKLDRKEQERRQRTMRD